MTTPIRRVPRGAFAAALLIPLAAAGCGSDGGDGEWAGTVTDSAGVALVSNPEAGLWEPGEEWTLAEVVSIGALDGDPTLQFGQIVGVDTDGEGLVYVLDQQAREVRVFDRDGAFVRTVGEPGEGPGQLGRGTAGVFVRGDEVWVADVQNARVSRFDLEGASLGSFRLDFTAGIPLRWDEVGDRVVAQLRRIDPSATAGQEPTGDRVVAFGPEGAVVDTLLTLPPGRSLSVAGNRPQFRFFEAEPMWDAEAGRAVSASNDRYRIEIRDGDGTLTRVVSRPFERQEVTPDHERAFLDAVRDLMTGQGVPPAAVDQVLQGASFADHLPAFASVLVGPDGSLWVQQLTPIDDLTDAEGTFDPQDLGSPRWDVFDDEGRFLGVVEFPGRFQPLRVLDGEIWGVDRDAMDVQRVKGYRVSEGAG